MSNKLFIVCPFSGMEGFLRNRYGNDIFFHTSSGAVIQRDELEYLTALRDFIIQEEIKTVYIVTDTSCRFIDRIVKRKKLFGVTSEKILEDLYIEHYFTEFKEKTLFQQYKKLAELNILNQANEMRNSPILGSCIAELEVEIKCLITSKEKNAIAELALENSNDRIYEL